MGVGKYIGKPFTNDGIKWVVLFSVKRNTLFSRSKVEAIEFHDFSATYPRFIYQMTMLWHKGTSMTNNLSIKQLFQQFRSHTTFSDSYLDRYKLCKCDT